MQFVQELRRLFALLTGSQRSYVDPQSAITVRPGAPPPPPTYILCLPPSLPTLHCYKLLKAAFAKGSGVQQDIGEFTHKLLEWMEEAFSPDRGSDSPDQARCGVHTCVCSLVAVYWPGGSSHLPCSTNPVVDLFTGHCQTEGVSAGQHFVNESAFGAFPVQVWPGSHRWRQSCRQSVCTVGG